jgi:hypothetical protein
LLEHFQSGFHCFLPNQLLSFQATLHPSSLSDRRKLDERRVEGDRKTARAKNLKSVLQCEPLNVITLVRYHYHDNIISSLIKRLALYDKRFNVD